MPFDGHDEISATLLLAADLIRTRGHTKGVRQDSGGRLCLHGALEMANSALEMKAARRVHDFAGIGTPWPTTLAADGWSLAGWNNAPERTAEEVIAVLKGAAAFKG